MRSARTAPVMRGAAIVATTLLALTAGCSADGDSPGAEPGAGATSGSPTVLTQEAKVTVGRTGDAKGRPGCSSTSCAYLRVTLENVDETATCSAHQNNPNDTDWTNTYVLGNGTHRPGWYYGWPGSQVWVICDGVESNHFTW